MVKVSLAAEAAAEVERLTKARGLAAAADPFTPEAPFVGVARRNAIRRALGRRVLLLWRLAYEEANGRLVESTLVALTIDIAGNRFDVRHADWWNPFLLALVHDRCGAWRESVQQTVHAFTSTRVARERAIAAAHATATHAFQSGLFDRRADRAHAVHSQAASELSGQLAARMKSAAAAGAISLRSPELLLVLIPADAARM